METRLANIPPCLIGMEACVGAHHLSRRLRMLGHDARLMPAKYVRPSAMNRGKLRVFRVDGKIGVSAGLRGGAGRTRTCNQIVMNGMLQSPAAGNFLIRPAQTQQQR